MPDDPIQLFDAVRDMKRAIDDALSQTQVEPIPNPPHLPPVSDSEIRRLEDRIEASNREAQLRLDGALAGIRGAVDRLIERSEAAAAELREQRVDARSARESYEADATASRQEQATLRRELTGSIGELQIRQTGQFQWLMGTILAVGLAVVAAVFAGEALWGTGFQSGQAAAAAAPQPARH